MSVHIQFDYSDALNDPIIYHNYTKIGAVPELEMKNRDVINIYNKNWENCGKLYILLKKEDCVENIDRLPVSCNMCVWRICKPGKYTVKVSGIKNTLNHVTDTNIGCIRSHYTIARASTRSEDSVRHGYKGYTLFEHIPSGVCINAILSNPSENDSIHSLHIIKKDGEYNINLVSLESDHELYKDESISYVYFQVHYGQICQGVKLYIYSCKDSCNITISLAMYEHIMNECSGVIIGTDTHKCMI